MTACSRMSWPRAARWRGRCGTSSRTSATTCGKTWRRGARIPAPRRCGSQFRFPTTRRCCDRGPGCCATRATDSGNSPRRHRRAAAAGGASGPRTRVGDAQRSLPGGGPRLAQRPGSGTRGGAPCTAERAQPAQRPKRTARTVMVLVRVKRVARWPTRSGTCSETTATMRMVAIGEDLAAPPRRAVERPRQPD